jgi:hypothetical protein
MVETQEVEVILSEPQEAVLESRKANILEMAGKGSGKSETIGISTGMFISELPEAAGFIGANTIMQLSQSTLDRVFKSWKKVHDFTEYDPKFNRGGAYVIDKKPPPSFQRFRSLRDYRGTISFYNGALVYIGSLENYKAHDGKEFAWAHLDETKDTKADALKEVIQGRLRQYGLWYAPDGGILFNAQITAPEAEALGLTAWNPLYIHTAPALVGVDWLNKMFSLDAYAKEIKARVTKKDKDFFYKEFDNNAVCIYSTYHNAHNLPPNYIENQILNLKDEDSILKHVDGYPFSKSGGEYFHAFRRDKHVKPVAYVPGVPVLTTWDFNVVPYMTCLCAQVFTKLVYIDPRGIKYENYQPDTSPLEVMVIKFYREYCLPAPRNSTEAVCAQFSADHNPRETEVFYYGDASGLNRIPGLGSTTNFKLIAEHLGNYIHNDSKRVKAPNVAVLARRDLLNDIFSGRHPAVEIEIDEGMENTIKDMENLKLGPQGKIKAKEKDPETKEKFETLGHTSDALEYLVSEVCKYLLKT